MAAVICLVGIPIWWNTTKTYRASLPYEEISSLANISDFKVRATWSICVDNKISRNDMKNMLFLDELLKNLTETKMILTHTEYFFDCPTSQIVQKLVGSFNDSKQAADELSQQLNSEKSMHQVDKQDDEQLSYVLYFLPQLNERRNNGCNIISNHSQIVVLFNRIDFQGRSTCFQQLIDYFKNNIYPEASIGKFPEKKIDMKQSSVSVQTAAGYEISFTLANANPFDVILDWDIENSIATQLKPFLKKIEMLGPFSISSQVLNFVDVGMKPQRSADGYYYPIKKVPLLLNPLESRLNEYTSNYPILNFVLYSPSTNEMPLTIKHKNQSTISFISPRWGGVVINNINKDFLQSKSSLLQHNKLTISTKDAMSLFIGQFRELIGLQKLKTEPLSSSSSLLAVTNLEVKYLLIKKTIENMERTISTLLSLSQLLEKISNIVIRDDIKNLIVRSIEEVRNAELFLMDGNLTKAFKASKIAFVSSEKAFFDHSLLSLLYFPEDQKYAIYLPLFLPICFPIFLASLGAFKFFKYGKNKVKSQ
eukprot:gene659-1327_t